MEDRGRRTRDLLSSTARPRETVKTSGSDGSRWEDMNQGHLTQAQRVSRKRAVEQLNRWRSTAHRQLMLSGCLFILCFGIALFSNQHLGKARYNSYYSDRVTTFQYANATRCVPKVTCPYVTPSDSAKAKYLYRDPDTKEYVRVLVDNPSSMPNDMQPVELPVFIPPCDVRMDELLITAVFVGLVHATALPILAKDNLRKYKQFRPFLYYGDIKETPSIVFRAQTAISFVFVGYGVCFFLFFLAISSSTTCQHNVSDLYYLGVGLEGLITVAACLNVIMSARRKAQTMDYKWAYFALTIITLVQMLFPMGQLVWHLNHTACVLQEPPYLEYAPFCQIGLLVAVVFTGVGVYGAIATHFVSAKAKPYALQLYGKLSFLTSASNGCVAAVFMVAVSGFFNEQYLRTDVKYCQYDPSLEGQDVEGCITRGILPWGWFNNCFKNTTAEPYTSQDQMFSCRLCQDTSTCVDSEPNDAYIENSTRTTVAALSYVVYCLSSAFGFLFAQFTSRMMADDLDIKREIARIALKQYLAGLEGVQLQDVVIRLIKKKPPSWDEHREAAYFRRHFPGRPEGDNWRVRVKYSSAWKDLVTLYGPKRAFIEGEKVMERYIEDCRSLQQETVRSLNLDPQRIEAEASDDEEFTMAVMPKGVVASPEGEEEAKAGEGNDAEEEEKEGGEMRASASVASASTDGSTSESDSSDGESDDDGVGLGGVVLEGMNVTTRGVHQF